MFLKFLLITIINQFIDLENAATTIIYSKLEITVAPSDQVELPLEENDSGNEGEVDEVSEPPLDP